MVAVLAALYIYPFVRIFCDAPDAGVFLYGADLLNRGAVPSRDFVEPQGPGSFVWLALFFKFFGTTIETARWVLSATGVALGLIAFWLSRRLGATGVFAAVFVVMMSVPLMPVNSPHYDSNLFALGALAVFLSAWDEALKGEEPAAWKLMLSALLCGVTMWMLQQKGCYVAFGLLLSLVWLMRRRALRAAAIFSGAFALTCAAPFGAFWAAHALKDAVWANYIWPMTTYSDINAAPYGSPFWKNVRHTLAEQGLTPVAVGQEVAFALPFLLIAGMPLLLPLAARLSGKQWFATRLLPYWLTAYALWFAELHRMDMGHLRNGAVMMAVLFFSICEAGGNRFVRRAGLAVTLSLVLTGVTHYLMSWQGVKRDTRRGAVYLTDNADVFDFLEKHTHAGEEVFVYPYQPIYYFVENLRNPTRFSYLLYTFHTADQFREAEGDIERKKIRYVVYDKVFSGKRLSEVFPAYQQPADAQLTMEPYLAAHYRVANEGSRFRILERRE